MKNIFAIAVATAISWGGLPKPAALVAYKRPIDRRHPGKNVLGSSDDLDADLLMRRKDDYVGGEGG